MHVVLPRALHERLRQRAATSGRSAGAVVREALERELGRERPGAAGARGPGAGARLLAAGTIAGIHGP